MISRKSLVHPVVFRSIATSKAFWSSPKNRDLAGMGCWRPALSDQFLEKCRIILTGRLEIVEDCPDTVIKHGWLKNPT